MKWSWLRWTLGGGSLVAVVGVVVVAVGSPLDSGNKPDSAADARMAYCLAPAHVADLLNAAAALGLIQPGATADRIVAYGKTSDLRQWHSQQSADFNRACGAESSVALPRGAGSSWLRTTSTTVLQVLLGSLLALLSSNFGMVKERRKTRADALRVAWQEFTSALLDYTETRAAGSPRGVPSSSTIDRHRASVVLTARRAGATHRSWQDPEKLIGILENELGGAVENGWVTDSDHRAQRQQAIAADVESASGLVERVAAGTERVFRPLRGV